MNSESKLKFRTKDFEMNNFHHTFSSILGGVKKAAKRSTFTPPEAISRYGVYFVHKIYIVHV